MGTAGKQIIPRERLDFAEKLYLAGKPRQEISRRICKRYGVTARTARRYLARVEAKLAVLPKPSAATVFHRVEAMLLRAYDRADKAIKVVKWTEGSGDSKTESSRIFHAPETGTMVTAAWRLAELHGIAPQKIEHSGPDGGPVSVATLSRVVMLPALELESDDRPGGDLAAEPGSADGVSIE